MFDTPAQAHQVIEERFAPDLVEMVTGQLRPAIVFSTKDADRKGGSRIGGTPDLPKEIEWPRRTIPANVDEIAGRAGEPYDGELKTHLAAGLPYAFFAQVDLGEAAGLGEAAKLLPNEGRLLFFYDMVAGPFDTGTESARVIWDRSPADALSHAAIPTDLASAAVAYRKMVEDANKQYGLQPEARLAGAPEPGTPYGGSARPMALKAALQLPSYSSIEFQASGRLEKTYSADQAVVGGAQAFSQAYSELSDDTEPQTQLLGAPQPVQDDPRYDAVVSSEFKTQFLSGDDWAKNRDMIMEKAKDWRLLLQVEVPDWMQENSEGTVYFLIREKDLEERAFDRVVAVYQQT
ncbi:DUF1963 domain-containing protein [Neorhizobium alkalisoli]|uniref:Uncharacterized protein YwqG n=1 Tax=Neorhizobium alkalisoli TaxID=528178 RepID=A0A561QP37_9HYPH|nr:DUF1963 domain-containing protein [Neorhizobium alkalisoli]TWF52128.1 uncharacterized protein YwqG [Neorhizobium alkalisoli]